MREERRYFFPAVRYSSLPRPRLTEAALAHDPAIVVFSGGPGAGKTLAARETAEAVSRRGAACVWIALGPADAEFEAFWQRLLASLDRARLLPRGSLAAEMLRGGLGAATPELVRTAMSSALADEFGEGRPLALILDDLHLVADRALRSVVDVVEAVPRLRVIATTRNALPALTGIAARLRVPVREIDEPQLAFTEEETAGLVRLRLPRLAAHDQGAVATALQREARGWPLASHALVVEYEDRPGAGRPASRGEFVRSYVDRLIQRAPGDGLERLLASSLLAEISPRILVAMLESDPVEVERFFDESDEASLSHWEDADGTRWYRHHHLIRDELHRRAHDVLGEERCRRLYRRAARALRRDRPRDAVQAAIRGGAWDLLDELLLENPIQTIMKGKDRRPEDPWLRDIPAGVRERHPVLAAFAMFDEYANPVGRFQTLYTGLSLLAGPAMAGATEQAGLPGAVASTLRMVAARLSGNEALALKLAGRSESALRALSAPELARIIRSLGIAYTQRAITYLHADRFDDAERTLAQLDPARRGAGEDDGAAFSDAHRAGLAAFTAAWRGDMPEARGLVEQCRQLLLPIGWHSAYIGAGYRIASALAELEGGDADETRLGAAAAHLRALSEHEGTIEHWPYLLEIETTLIELRHGPRVALARLESELAERGRRFRLLASRRLALETLHARLTWQAGRAPQRRSRRTRAGLVDAYIALGQRDTGRARSSIATLISDPALARFPRRRAEALLLHASLSLGEGETATATASARLAADLMEAHGMTLPYRVLPRETLHQLKASAPHIRSEFGRREREAAPSPALSLTDAEIRALSAVAEHGTVQAAADALFLSHHTVRQQLKLSYRKLGVHNRADAIRIAHESGRLDGHLAG